MQVDEKGLSVARSLLRYEREQRGWSQAKLAELVGSTPDNISRWERGVARPSPHFREQLCLLFEKNAEELGLLSGTRKEQETQQEQGIQKAGILDPLLPHLSAKSKTLVGRETFFFQLTEWCTNAPTPATSVLYGLPGVGKTALVCILAQHARIRETFHDGILWADLGPDARLTDHLSRWSRLLGVPTAELERAQGVEDWVKLLRLVIGERRLLLLLDDVWRLEDAAPFLQLAGANCIAVLTTRSPLLAVQIASQDGAMLVPELNEQEAVTLLSRFVPTLVMQEPEMVRFLLAQAGTLPLSLMLMGKYLASQSYSEQPRRIHKAVQALQDVEHRLTLSLPRSLLDPSSNVMLDVPLSLKSVIALSDHRLSPAAQEALRSLSVLPAKPSSFSEEIAGTLLAHPLEVLDELSDAGLLESNGVQRYMLHQTIADYARLDLEDDSAYLRLMEVGMNYLHTYAKNYGALEQERDLLGAAMDVAHRLAHRTTLIQGGRVLTPFLQAQHLYGQATEYLLWAYDAAEREADEEAVVDLSLQLGMAKEKEGDYEQAQQYLHRGLNLARQRKSKEHLSFLARLAYIAMKRGQLADARAFLQEGLVLASVHGDANAQCMLFTYYGQLYAIQDDLEQAESYVQRGLALLDAVDDAEKKCGLLRFVGMLHSLRGEYERAQQVFLEGLEVARQAHNEEVISFLLRQLGVVAGRRGKYRQTETYYREALALSEQTGSFEQTALLWMNLGLLALQQGHDSQAEAYLQEALVLAQRIGHAELIAASLINLSVLVYEMEAYDRAETICREALAFVQQVDTSKTNLCLVLCILTATKLKQNEMLQAADYLQEAMTIAEQVGTPDLWCAVYEVQGEYALTRQDVQQAAEAFRNLEKSAPKGDVLALSTAQYGLARVAAAQGRRREAQKQGRAVLYRWREMGYRRAKEVEAWVQSLSADMSVYS